MQSYCSRDTKHKKEEDRTDGVILKVCVERTNNNKRSTEFDQSSHFKGKDYNEQQQVATADTIKRSVTRYVEVRHFSSKITARRYTVPKSFDLYQIL